MKRKLEQINIKKLSKQYPYLNPGDIPELIEMGADLAVANDEARMEYRYANEPDFRDRVNSLVEKR